MNLQSLKRFRVVGAIGGIFTLSLLISNFLGFVYTDAYKGMKSVYANGIGECLPAANQKDESSPFSVTAPSGQIISTVSLKAGTNCFGPYTTNGTFESSCASSGSVCTPVPNSCYQITGIGGNSVTVVKTGIGKADVCKDVSHIEVIWGDPASPTPSSSPRVSPSPSPSPSESPTPSDEPEQSPSPSPSEEPEESPTPTPEESLTPTPTPTPSPGFQLGGPPPPPDVAEGQVLGASTLGATGAFEETLFYLIFVLGAVSSGIGIKKFTS